MTGEFSADRFRSQYGFLSELHQTELGTLKDNLKRARKMRRVLVQLCHEPEFNDPTSGGVQLEQYNLTNDEWVIIDQLYV